MCRQGKEHTHTHTYRYTTHTHTHVQMTHQHMLVCAVLSLLAFGINCGLGTTSITCHLLLHTLYPAWCACVCMYVCECVCEYV